MTRRNIVHIVGTGTIGEPLIGLFLDYKEELGFDEVTFHKRTPLLTDRSKVTDLCRRGARLYTDPERLEGFRKLGLEPVGDHHEALTNASVVIDCTPAGNENKPTYQRYADSTCGFVAQGSENGFGKPYARGINDKALVPGEDRYIQVVSCNTHNVSLLLHAIAYRNGRDYDNLVEARFVCMRRASDISQAGEYIPAPEVGKHSDPRYGTHHARDAAGLFETIGVSPKLWSSAIKLNTQYMHTIWFDIRTKQKLDLAEVKRMLKENDRVSVTYKKSGAEVFAFGRDHGHYGRIMNQTVIVQETLAVHGEGHEVCGYCFTPQDGNSLLSSVAAACWFVDPATYEARIQCLRPYFFDEV